MTAANLVKDPAEPARGSDQRLRGRGPGFGTLLATAARRLGRHRVLVALVVFTFAVSLAVQHWYFPLYSGDNDEPVYVLQAKMLLQGKITLSGAAQGDFFRPWLTLQHDGRLYTEFLPGWPAVLALSQLVFGTMVLAPAAAAAAWVATTYGLARELLTDRRTALLAAGVVALSPLTLIHGGLYLSYVFTAALLTGAAACLVRGVRLGSRRALTGAGALFGAALLTRPLDVALVALPCGVYGLIRLRRQPRAAARRALWVAVGVAPFVLVLLAYNARVTGSPVQAPLSAGGPLVNKLGFGQRQMVPDHPPLTYGVHTAVHALLLGLRTLPGFLFGGVLIVGLAALGALPRRQRLERLLLVALALAFPAGYFFWFTSLLAATHAVNGIGPHYYVPSLGFLAILAASGLLALAHRWRPALVVGLVAAVPVTAWAIPDKITVRHFVNDDYRRVQALIPAQLATPAVVLVAGTTYVPGAYPFLNNPPDLRARVIYAADLGVRDNRIAERAPGRRVYRLSLDELRGNDIFGPRGSLLALHTTAGAVIQLRLHITNPTHSRYVTSYLRLDGRSYEHVLDTASAPGRSYTDHWLLVKGPSTAATKPDVVSIPSTPADHDLVVGAALGPRAGQDDAELWEYRNSLGVRDEGVRDEGVRDRGVGDRGQLLLQTPGARWRRITFPQGQLWFESTLAGVLTETAAPAG